MATPVRVLIANVHTTSRARVVVPWLWSMAAVNRCDCMLLSEVTPRHARLLRARPRWVLIQETPYTEAIYARRRFVTARAVHAPASTGWARKRVPGHHPGRSVPVAMIRGWLLVGSIHLPPGWTGPGPVDRQRAGSGMLLKIPLMLPVPPLLLASAPVLLAGDWNASPERLAQWRASVGFPVVRGRRIMHAIGRRVKLGPLTAIGRASGMDHDAYVIEAHRA